VTELDRVKLVRRAGDVSQASRGVDRPQLDLDL
jgi:hypothetical protein